MDWYSVKGVFRWYFKETGETERYEERVLLFKGKSFDDVISKAENEAIEYCEDDPMSNVRIEALEVYNAFSLSDVPAEGIEVFSETHNSELETDDYIDKYYPDSNARS